MDQPSYGNLCAFHVHQPTTLLTYRLLGIFTTLLIPETKRKTLEELTGTVVLCRANHVGEEQYLHMEPAINGNGSAHDSVEKQV